MERRGYRITGRVQGIGYRSFARRWARDLDLRGWVCNRADGSVEVQVEGSKERLTRFEDSLRRGPASGRVEALERIAAIPDEPWAEFEIRFG